MRNVGGRTLGLFMKTLLTPCKTKPQVLVPNVMRCSSCGCPMRSSSTSFPRTINRWLTLSATSRQHEPQPQQPLQWESDHLAYLDAAILQLALKGRSNDALQKYLRAMKLQLLPSQETLHQLCRALYRHRNLAGLCTVHDTLILYLQDKAISRRRRRSLVYLYTILINLIHKSTPRKQPIDMSAVIILCNEMAELGLTNRAALYNTLINILAERGEYDNCNTLFEYMKKWNIQPNLYTYGAMLKASARKKDLDGMGKLLDDMYDHGIAVDRRTVSTLVTALCRVHEFAAAEDLVAQLHKYSAGDRILMSSTFHDRLHINIERWRNQRQKKRQRMLRWRISAKNKKRKKA